jgi:acyl-coenzyme A thioesterase PaaI-like protein
MPGVDTPVRSADPAGIIHGTGAVTRLGRTVGFIEGSLFDADGRVLARGTGTAIPTPFPDTNSQES